MNDYTLEQIQHALKLLPNNLSITSKDFEDLFGDYLKKERPPRPPKERKGC